MPVEKFEATRRRAAWIQNDILGCVHVTHANEWDCEGSILGVTLVELVHADIDVAALRGVPLEESTGFPTHLFTIVFDVMG